MVGADDFASMKEVLHRRYTRMMAEGQPLPQLVVVDGGKGQLSAAVEAFDEMGIREMWLWWELPSVLRKFISPVIRFRYTSTRNLHRSE